MHSHDGYRKILDQEKHDDVSFTTVFTTEGTEVFSFFLNLRVLCVLCSEKSDFFAFQRSRTSFRDTYVHEVADTMCAPIEHYDTVLFRTAEQLVTRALGDSFHEDFVRLSDTTLVGLGRSEYLNMKAASYPHSSIKESDMA